MANGRSFGRFEAMLGIVGVLTLGTSFLLVTGINPLPAVRDALSRVGSLSSPDTAWRQRVADQPTRTTVVGNAVVVSLRSGVESRDLATGDVRWHRGVDWSVVAGEGTGAVVVVGKPKRGLEALDPVTGSVRWSDPDAVGAWAFRTAVLVLTCGGGRDCTVSRRAPGDGAPGWRVTVPGLSRDSRGGHRGGVGSREIAGTYRAAVEAVPGDLPPLLGLAVQRGTEVLDTGAGRLLARVAPPGDQSVAAVVGGRVVVATAKPEPGGCRYALDGRDAATGRALWHKEGYDAHTTAACQQRRAPAGGGGVLAVARPDGREALLGVADGREVWTGAAGESVRALDGRYALVRSADSAKLRALDASSGAVRWEHPLPARATVTLCRYAAVVADVDAGRWAVYDPGSGRTLLDVRTQADLVGCGPGGLVLGRGRNLGYLAFSGAAG